MKVYTATYAHRGARHAYVAETQAAVRAWIVDREREADEFSAFLTWEPTRECDLEDLYARADPLLAHLLETAEQRDTALHARMQRFLIDEAKRRVAVAQKKRGTG